jgi:hypothetical protein
MKRFFYSILGLSLIVLAACERNTINSEDELIAWEQENLQEIQTVLSDTSDLFFDALDDGNEENIDIDEPTWLTALAKTSEIKTRFGRIRTSSVERNVEVIFDSDTTATAYVHTKTKGIFVVHQASVDSDTVIFSRFQKPMVHDVERIVHLRKVFNTDYVRRNWRILDVSMKNGTSPSNTVEIVDLTIMPSGQDTTVIYDPLNYFINGINMFTLPRYTEINLRVTVKNYSANPIIYPEGTEATEFVRLQYGRNALGHFARTDFRWVGKDDLGNNIYEGAWLVRQFPGIHHAVIDVIDNGTVLDSDNEAYPYNSNTWATPYRVTLF